MRILFILILTVAVAGCECEKVKPACNTHASVVDLSASGCEGLGFKLSNGSLIVPMHSFCGFGDAPLANFQLVAGQEVMISYDIVEGSPCSAISAAAIRCITLVEPDEK